MSSQSLLSKLPTTSVDGWSAKTQHTYLDHYAYLLRNTKLTYITLTPFQCTKFEGDFYGLLFDLKIPDIFHPIITAFNKLSHPTDFKAETTTIVIPDLSELVLITRVNNVVTI